MTSVDVPELLRDAERRLKADGWHGPGLAHAMSFLCLVLAYGVAQELAARSPAAGAATQ